MSKWTFLTKFAVCSAVLAAPFPPLCRGAACCAPSAQRLAVCSAVLSAPFPPLCRGAACCAPNAQTVNASDLSLFRIAPAAQDQASPNPSPQNPAPATHKIKVWTNEDLIATRTPADLYIFAKESQAAALQEEAFNNLMSCFAPEQTEGNAGETQKEIDATFQSISDSEEAVAQSRRALRASPENLKLRNQMELAQRTQELNHAREHLWKLQEHLQELQKSPAQEPAPAQPPVPPPPNQSPP